MNRRQLLAGVASLPLMSIPAIAAITENETFAYGINLLGMKVKYSKHLAEDLEAVHGLHPLDIIERMYGTQFHITSTRSFNHITKKFTMFMIKTDDSRDNFFGWMVYDDQLGTPNGVYWKRTSANGQPMKIHFRQCESIGAYCV